MRIKFLLSFEDSFPVGMTFSSGLLQIHYRTRSEKKALEICKELGLSNSPVKIKERASNKFRMDMPLSDDKLTEIQTKVEGGFLKSSDLRILRNFGRLFR